MMQEGEGGLSIYVQININVNHKLIAVPFLLAESVILVYIVLISGSGID
jgi:hypothetical protein